MNLSDFIGTSSSLRPINKQYNPYILVTTSTVFNVPSDGKYFVLVSGGGGSGGRIDGAGKTASGGGSGFISSDILDLNVGEDITITIGAGGAMASAISMDGNDGGISSFGSYLSAQGGKRGLFSNTGEVVRGGDGYSNGGASVSGAGYKRCSSGSDIQTIPEGIFLNTPFGFYKGGTEFFDGTYGAGAGGGASLLSNGANAGSFSNQHKALLGAGGSGGVRPQTGGNNDGGDGFVFIMEII